MKWVRKKRKLYFMKIRSRVYRSGYSGDKREQSNRYTSRLGAHSASASLYTSVRDMSVIEFFLLVLSTLVGSQKVLDLSSTTWHLYNWNRTIDLKTSVPGGVYSSLEDAAFIDDILFGKNDVRYRWISRENWTYFRNFEITESDMNHTSIWLVLHGVDTVGDVFINSIPIFHCENMFVRYTANVKPHLQVGRNNITIELKSPIKEARKLAQQVDYRIPPTCPPSIYHGECHINMLRKMQASFAWDWGPAFPSLGIWKNPEIVMSTGPQIEYVIVKTTPEANTWRVNLIVGFGPSEITFDDTIWVEFSWKENEKIEFSYPLHIRHEEQQKIDINFKLPKEKIILWWPNGYGKQQLYMMRIYYKYFEKMVNIGFRTISLIQSNLTEDTSKGTLFYFLVNGKKIFAKGSNWIPSHILPERLSDQSRVLPLLEAAAAAHFNMIRVWGGGVYESDMFYEACDRLGIMVWQDLMFACSMYPVTDTFLNTVKVEIEQNIQRLQHHPSIAVWAGNNENEAALVQNWYGTSGNFTQYKKDYLKLYVDTIKPIVLSTDNTRSYLTSSPSNDLGDISFNPSDSLHGDVHYYNYINDGWNFLIYPKPRFASEYGTQSFPSYRCLRGALPLNTTYWGGPSVEHRQHAPAGNAILLNQISFNLPTSNKIEDIIYLSQINQAMTMKTESERYRRLKSVLLDSNEGLTMGALYWQLNDIWQAPSWSSIDYCGQWKMLHYFAKDFFSPIIVSPEMEVDKNSVSLYIVIDGDVKNKNVNLTFKMYNWLNNNNWAPFHTINQPVSLEDNISFLALKVPINQYCSNRNCFYTTFLEDGGSTITPENFLFYLPLNRNYYPDTYVQIIKIESLDDFTAKFILKADNFALFVWLELYGIQGKFSKNGFHMFSPTTEVIFRSKDMIDSFSLNRVTITWLKRNYSENRN